MLRYNMVVVTRDNVLKRAVKRVTTATGAAAEFIGDVSGINPSTKVDLAIFDARKDNPDKLFLAKVPQAAKIIYVIAADSLVSKIPLLKDSRVTSLFCHDERFDEDEFIATATKCLRGEVFGLQKYFPWGVTTFSMVLKNYKEKGRAIDVLMRYATLAGVRGPVRDRIQLVADELMMNALYHAPTDDKGRELYAGKSLKDLAQLDNVNAIQVQYGCSGRYFGISVRDGGGSLSRDRALEYLVRAKTGTMIEDKATGAGLGLVSVLRSVSKLVFNLDFSSSTEVIGLFDMDLFARGKMGARSLHLFIEAPKPVEVEEEDTARVPSVRPSNSGKWAFAAILLAVASALGTALYMRESRTANAARPNATASQSATVTVHPDPGDARVTLNDAALPSGQAVALPSNGPYVLRVSKAGFQTWEKDLGQVSPGNNLELHVNLPRSRR